MTEGRGGRGRRVVGRGRYPFEGPLSSARADSFPRQVTGIGDRAARHPTTVYLVSRHGQINIS